MKFDKPQPLIDLAKIIDAEIVGDPTIVITGINDVGRANNGELIFVDSEKYLALALAGGASVIVVPATLQSNSPKPAAKTFLLTARPHEAINKIAAAMFSHLDSEPTVGIHPTAVVAPTAKISKNCSIGPYCTVGEHVSIGGGTNLAAHVIVDENCRIGRGCRIGSHSTIHRRCLLGDEVIVDSGCHIGTNSFYFYRDGEVLHRGNALGAVEIAAKVEMGAGCTIDRGISGDTFIGEGSKLDNQVHIGHDAHIGRKVIIAAQVGIAGYVQIDDEVTIRGQVGIMHRVKVGKGAELLGKSGIDQDVAENQIVFGIPAMTRDRYAQRRRAVRKRIRKLEKDAEIALGKQREFQERVLQAIADESGKDLSEIKLEQTLIDDLELDSLDRVELQMALEEEFHQGLVELHMEERLFENVNSVKDVVELVRKSLRVQT